MTSHSLLKDLHDGTDRWKLLVRISNKWNVFPKSTPTDLFAISMVLIDEEGTKIQATVVNKKLHDKYRQTAVEGRIYFIANFVVTPNINQYKATNHQYKLTFTPHTYIMEDTGPIPSYSYSFFPVVDILKTTESNHVDHLIDVLAYVKSVGPLEEYRRDNEAKHKLRKLLTDNEDNDVECILFDECSTNAYTSYLQNMDMDAPIVVLLNLARIGFSEAGVPQICNSYNATRVYFNLPIKEVKDFIESRSEGLSPVLTTVSQQVPPYSSQPSAGSIMMTDNRIPISSIPNQKIGDIFCIICEIQKLETTHGWIYDGCGKCSAKIKDENGIIKCPLCKKKPDSIEPKLKLHYTVVDSSGSASVLFWDKHAVQLIQKSAPELKTILKEKKCEYDIPDELDRVIGKRVILKLKRNDYNTRHPNASISVVNYTFCEDLMDQFVEVSAEGDNVHAIHADQTSHNTFKEHVLADNDNASSGGAPSSTPINLDPDDVPISQLPEYLTPKVGKGKRKTTGRRIESLAEGPSNSQSSSNTTHQDRFIKVIKQEKR